MKKEREQLYKLIIYDDIIDDPVDIRFKCMTNSLYVQPQFSSAREVTARVIVIQWRTQLNFFVKLKLKPHCYGHYTIQSLQNIASGTFTLSMRDEVPVLAIFQGTIPLFDCCRNYSDRYWDFNSAYRNEHAAT